MYEELILLVALGLPLAIAVYAANVPMYPEKKAETAQEGT
jgi:hypothetical protein